MAISKNRKSRKGGLLAFDGGGGVTDEELRQQAAASEAYYEAVRQAQAQSAATTPAPAAPAAPLSSVSAPAPPAGLTPAPLSSTPPAPVSAAPAAPAAPVAPVAQAPLSAPAPASDDWMSGQWYNPNVMPENFDWQRYVAANQDLGAAGIDTQAEAQRHYFNYGQQEGRSIGALTPTRYEDLSQEDARAGREAYRQATGFEGAYALDPGSNSSNDPMLAWINQNYIPQGQFKTDYAAARPADTFEYLNTMETSNRPVDQLDSIRKAWEANKDKPGEMRQLMEQYGVTLGDLSQATGETYSQLNNWVKNGNLLGSIGFSVNQPGAYDKFKATTAPVYDPNAKVVAGPSTAASREAAFISSQQKASNTFDPLAYEKYKQFITAGMPPEEAFKQSGLKSQYYAPESVKAPTADAGTTADAAQARTTPPEHTYDEGYGIYDSALRTGDISAEKIQDLYGYYDPEFSKNIIKIKGEIDQQKKAGTADYWGAGNLASPDAAAWDAAFRLAEKGVGSLYDLKLQDGQTVNTKTGDPLVGFGNAYNHDLDFHINYTKEGLPYLTASNQKSEWVDKYRAPVTAAALLAAGYYGPELFAGAGAAGAGAGAGAGLAAGEAAALAASEAAAFGGAAGAGAGAAGAGAGLAAGSGAAGAAGAGAGTSFATKIGMQLGLSGTTATMAGNALIQGSIAEMAGGDFVKGAVSGAIAGGALGANVGAFVTESLGLTVGSAVQTAIGNTIIGTVANGGDLKAAAQGAIGQYLGNEIANSDAVKNLVGSGAIGDAVRGGIRGSITNAAQGRDALEGAIVGGTSAFINRVTSDALKDNKSFTPVERRNITNGITAFVTAKASGATDEQAFMSTIAATGSRAAAQQAVRSVNRAPDVEMGPTSQGTNIQSAISPDELDARTGGGGDGGESEGVGGGSDEQTPFRAEVTGTPIVAEDPRASKVNTPSNYQLLTRAESDADELPEGAYYDIAQNAWFKPTGEIQDLSEAIIGNNEKYLRSRGMGGAGSTTSLGDSPSNQEILDQIGYIEPNDQGEIVVTAPREPTTDLGEIEITAPREPTTDLGEIEITAPREPVTDLGEIEITDTRPTPETPTTTPTTPAPTAPATPTAPTPSIPLPTVTAPPKPQLLQNFQTAGSNITYGGSSDWNVPAGYLRSEVIQQGAVDPLARVKQAQAELEREAMMQNIDPRLMQILQQRMEPSQQPEGNEYYSYGSEDSIDDILGGGGRTYKEGGFVEPLKATGGSMALPLLAKSGGALSHYGGREDYKHGKHVAGEGDGQSDDIPAWLADGEFVFPADVVSALGNGSTKAGTDKLYEMMHGIRDRARSKGPKDLPPAALKSPLDYLKSSKRST